MKYHSKTEVSGGNIYPCFATESISKERSDLRIKKGKKKVVFEITAKDAVAFRATTNMLTQLLTVYEKIKNLERK